METLTNQYYYLQQLYFVETSLKKTADTNTETTVTNMEQGDTNPFQQGGK